jgi:hypothetical protein
MDQPAFQKRFYAVVGGGAFALLMLVLVFIQRDLSPPGFAIAGLVWWIAMFASTYALIRSRQRSAVKEPFDRDQCVRSIRWTKRLIALFAVLLGFGVLTTQGEPLLPRVVGASVDVFFLAAFVHSLMRSQKRLKGLPTNSETGSTDRA